MLFLLALLVSVYGVCTPYYQSMIDSESVTYTSPIKCTTSAPYNTKETSNILALYDIAYQGQAWYEYRLATMIENLNTLPPDQIDAALDQFMEVFCPAPYFKGFIGITGDGTLITNRTMVRELYKDTAMTPGTHVPFNVKAYNMIASITPEAQVNHNSAYVNVTAFYEVVLRSGYPIPGFLLANGHYQNEFRVDKDGNICVSGFWDTFLDLNSFPHTSILAKPWDLPITSL